MAQTKVQITTAKELFVREVTKVFPFS